MNDFFDRFHEKNEVIRQIRFERKLYVCGMFRRPLGLVEQNLSRPHSNFGASGDRAPVKQQPCTGRVFEKLCFRDGLVWTVALTVDINRRLHIFAGKVRHGRGRSCYNSRRDTMEWETFLWRGLRKGNVGLGETISV